MSGLLLVGSGECRLGFTRGCLQWGGVTGVWGVTWEGGVGSVFGVWGGKGFITGWTLPPATDKRKKCYLLANKLAIFLSSLYMIQW